MRGGESFGVCPACGSPARRPFIKGKSNRAKRQRPKWGVCERGHQFVRKMG